jgi:large subunit ribosomal protein L21
MYAVVETGGKQYKVEPGGTLQVERLSAEVGATIELDRVLLVGDDDAVEIGQPTVAGARIVAEVVAQEKGEKLIIFRYKRKVRYRRKTGHRQSLTRLLIKEIAREGSGRRAASRSRAAQSAAAESATAATAESAPATESAPAATAGSPPATSEKQSE